MVFGVANQHISPQRARSPDKSGYIKEVLRIAIWVPSRFYRDLAVPFAHHASRTMPTTTHTLPHSSSLLHVAKCFSKSVDKCHQGGNMLCSKKICLYKGVLSNGGGRENMYKVPTTKGCRRVRQEQELKRGDILLVPSVLAQVPRRIS